MSTAKLTVSELEGGFVQVGNRKMTKSLFWQLDERPIIDWNWTMLEKIQIMQEEKVAEYLSFNYDEVIMPEEIYDCMEDPLYEEASNYAEEQTKKELEYNPDTFFYELMITGEIVGRVNYFRSPCKPDHLHILGINYWNDNSIFRSCVYDWPDDRNYMFRELMHSVKCRMLFNLKLDEDGEEFKSYMSIVNEYVKNEILPPNHLKAKLEEYITMCDIVYCAHRNMVWNFDRLKQIFLVS